MDSADNEAIIGSTASVFVSGNVSVDAGQTSDSVADSSADGDGTGIISGGALSSVAIVAGAVLAQVDGQVTAGSLMVAAQ